MAAHAGQLTLRDLTMGTSVISATTTYDFDFTIATTASIGSIKFDFCTTPLPTDACTAPTGLNVDDDAAPVIAIASQSGMGTAFTLHAANTDANTIVVTRTAASLASGSVGEMNFSNAVNPSTTNQAFYVRISTHTAIDGTGTATDEGSVAGSTANQITVNAKVEEYLKLCIFEGGTCAAPTGDLTVDLGTLSTTVARTGTSMMETATNALNGLDVSYDGVTLTSGSNTITAMGETENNTSTVGTEEFGFNSASPTGTAPIGTSGPIYDEAAEYGFNASAGTHIFATSTGAINNTTYTLNWLANVAGTTEPGLYTTTLTFTALAKF